MPVTLVLGLALASGVAPDGTPALFGFAFLFEWLLTFLATVLQRVMPFLASMQLLREGKRRAAPSKLILDGPITVHRWRHFAALALISAGLVLSWLPLIRAGAVIGGVGAVAFACFAATVLLRTGAYLTASVATSGKPGLLTKLTALAEILHQEHVTTIIALGVLEERGLGRDKNKPVDAEVADGRAKLQAVLDVIDREIIQHFRFAEEQLFPVLANRGYDELAKSLEQEHDAIQALAHLRLVDPLAPTRARLRAPHRCFRNHDLHRHEQSHAQAHPTLTPFPDGL